MLVRGAGEPEFKRLTTAEVNRYGTWPTPGGVDPALDKTSEKCDSENDAQRHQNVSIPRHYDS